jgi:triphosphoribosyl-dephospho-CoA synthase
MVLSRQLIRTAYEDACRQEIEALKPGNVHLFADGHRMSAEQFLTSARVSSGPLTDPGLSAGQRILEAVSATRQAVGTNTNLGILLLSAPLARAAEMPGQIRDNLTTVLDGMDMADADAVFRAIVLAEPGGLGAAAQHDVRERPKVPLLEAMRAAAGRDSIARQYAGGFDEVFSIGVVALDAGQGESGMWPTIRAYLAFLIAFPDSHVARKHGPQIAETVRADAAATRAALDGAADDDARIALLRDFDRRLKAQGINPGTSADLTVASLFVRNLLRQLARADG